MVLVLRHSNENHSKGGKFQTKTCKCHLPFLLLRRNEKRKPIIYKDDVTFCCFGLFGPRQHGVATLHRVNRSNVTQDSTITYQLQVSKKQPWTAIGISGVCKFSFSSNFTLSGRGLRYKLHINLTGLKKKKCHDRTIDSPSLFPQGKFPLIISDKVH